MHRSLATASFLLLPWLLCAPVAAQAIRYENVEQGWRIQVSRRLKVVPVEPNEQQIVNRWSGEIDVGGGDERKCTLWLVRIKKALQGGVTGAEAKPKAGGDAAKEGEGGKDEASLRDEATRQLNSATDLQGFLTRRRVGVKLSPPPGRPRVLKARRGERYTELENEDVRSFLLETPDEFLGLVAFGRFDGLFESVVLDAARSLERFAPGETKEHDYAGTELTNVDFRNEIRKKLVRGWEAFDTEHYIFLTNSKNKVVIDRMLVDLELMRTVYLERFPPAVGVDMESVISAVRFCKTMTDYSAYGGPPGTGGYWNPAQEELVLVDVLGENRVEILERNPNLKNVTPEDVLYHEAMHQYFHYSNGNLAPASWFNEGFGEVFAGAVADRAKKVVARVDRNKFRMFWITQAKGRGFPPLQPLLAMTQPEFYQPRTSLPNYAFAWAFCFFLEQHRKDAKGNKEWGSIPDRYLQNLRKAAGTDDPERRKRRIDMQETFVIQKSAYEATFGAMDLKPLEAAWHAEMKKWK